MAHISELGVSALLTPKKQTKHNQGEVSGAFYELISLCPAKLGQCQALRDGHTDIHTKPDVGAVSTAQSCQ